MRSDVQVETNRTNLVRRTAVAALKRRVQWNRRLRRFPQIAKLFSGSARILRAAFGILPNKRPKLFAAGMPRSRE